ncbi:MAG: hypothetical protein HYW48_00135 [Deltaproteobacteria bacterium]|nr:hypothetical protein [Deltaproteobacteria bacterium]
MSLRGVLFILLLLLFSCKIVSVNEENWEIVKGSCQLEHVGARSCTDFVQYRIHLDYHYRECLRLGGVWSNDTLCQTSAVSFGCKDSEANIFQTTWYFTPTHALESECLAKDKLWIQKP